MINKAGRTGSTTDWSLNIGHNKLQSSVMIPGELSVYSDVLVTYEWYHVATTYDGSILNMYINGELIDSTPGIGTIRDSFYDVVFGATSDGSTWSNEYYNGILDEVRIYSRVLSSNEIQQLAIIPEPLSSILFVTGGAVFAGRRYLRRKRSTA